MKKLLIAAIAAAMVGGANAAIIDNDVIQGTGSNLQVNGIASITGVSIGPASVVGTNLINTATTSHIGTTLIAGNDTIQSTGSNVQVNGIAELSVINVGPTTVVGVNAINSSDKTLAAAPGVTPFSLVVNNDTNQTSSANLQVNGVAQGSIVQLGSIRVNGTNLINTASTSVGSLGLVSGVIGNDITQGNTGSLQVNGIAEASGVRLGNARVTGVNSVNSADLSVLSAGVLNGVAFNDILQNSDTTVQVNGVAEAQVIGLGATVVDGTNLVNTASTTIGSAGFLNGVIDNNITQNTTNATQLNTVSSLSLARGGRITVRGVNAVNSADMTIGELAAIGVIAGNDIDQDALNIDQDNTITVGAVLRAGPLTVNGTNLVNTASFSAGSLALADAVIGNDIDQTANGIVQNNSITVAQGLGIGAIRLTGVNSINSADTSIVQIAGPSLALDNDITQSAGPSLQTNVVGVGAVGNIGPIRVNGTNSINSASHSVVQSAP